eukprot:SAG31_NODE_4518_length_3166_cov_1.642253_3_plen_127_part_00
MVWWHVGFQNAREQVDQVELRRALQVADEEDSRPRREYSTSNNLMFLYETDDGSNIFTPANLQVCRSARLTPCWSLSDAPAVTSFQTGSQSASSSRCCSTIRTTRASASSTTTMTAISAALTRAPP